MRSPNEQVKIRSGRYFNQDKGIQTFKRLHLENEIMEHQMKLFLGGFYGIKEGKQVIEVRLYDEKRRTLHLGDIITFSLLPELKETIRTEVIGLLLYKSFEELFININLEQWNARNWTVGQCVEQCRKYYSEEEETKYGALGIRIKLI